jgi:hypothetical protein
MGAVVPVVIVVAFWMIVGVIAVWFFKQALSVPTEMEIEAAHEQAAHQAHTAEAGATATSAAH